jgi:hypothetical protein
MTGILFSFDIKVWIAPFHRSFLNSDGQIAFSPKAQQLISARLDCTTEETELEHLLNGV